MVIKITLYFARLRNSPHFKYFVYIVLHNLNVQYVCYSTGWKIKYFIVLSLSLSNPSLLWNSNTTLFVTQMLCSILTCCFSLFSVHEYDLGFRQIVKKSFCVTYLILNNVYLRYSDTIRKPLHMAQYACCYFLSQRNLIISWEDSSHFLGQIFEIFWKFLKSFYKSKSVDILSFNINLLFISSIFVKNIYLNKFKLIFRSNFI